MLPDTDILAISILLIPVAAFLMMAFAHRSLPRHGDWFATGALGLCLLFSLVIFRRAVTSVDGLLFNATFSWLPTVSGAWLQGGFMVDRLTAIMLVVVTLVSFLVHLFSSKYMEGDVRYGRYYCSLLVFSASMLGLVLANNLLFLFIFWELVGLSSYLLIGHWYEKKSASDAAIKAFITTRVGDVGMFIGLMVCYLQVGSLQFADIFAAVEIGQLAEGWRTIAALGIFFGAMGKSAQFPLHVWLPDAMEGPTPVSALIHAATMVAAGVYLVGRMLPLFDEQALLVVAIIGAFTALFSATIALVQDDIKKVLAYSTVSQLGYMMLGLGVGGYVSGLFHLTTHAFFKAGLFLGSGAVIHAMHHEQSLSKYGGLFKKMPRTAVCYLLCTLALTGFPGFSGFWSKDAILADALAFSMEHRGFWFLPFCGFATAFLTAFYMFRQFFLTFTGKPRDRHAYEHAHEVPWQMLVPLMVFGALALVGGGFGGWFAQVNPKLNGAEQVAQFAATGYRSTQVDALLKAPLEKHSGRAAQAADSSHQPAAQHHSAAHAAHSLAMVLATVLGLSGMLLGALVYWQRRDGSTVISAAWFKERFQGVHRVLWHKYYFDELYWVVFVLSTHAAARFCALFDRKVIDAVVDFTGRSGKDMSDAVDRADQRVVDGTAVLGTARLAASVGESLSYTQSGLVRQYLTLTAVGVVLISVLLVALV